MSAPKHAPGSVVTFKNGAVAVAGPTGKLRITSGASKEYMDSIRAMRGTKSASLEEMQKAFKKYYSTGTKHRRSGSPVFKSARGAKQAMTYDANHTLAGTPLAPGAPGSRKYLRNPHRFDAVGVDTGSLVRKPATAKQLAARARGLAALTARRPARKVYFEQQPVDTSAGLLGAAGLSRVMPPRPAPYLAALKRGL